MNNQKALNIIKNLHDYMDPVAKERVSNNSFLRDSDVHAALSKAVHLLEVEATKESEFKTKKWTANDQMKLRDLYEGRQSIPELIIELDRSEADIRNRLKMLGLLNENL
ncbi:MAG TPA: hypothetical protein QF753_05270 [Victivallales bacterium]|nr:hypothetical protein [Victivallales bacterium]